MYRYDDIPSGYLLIKTKIVRRERERGKMILLYYMYFQFFFCRIVSPRSRLLILDSLLKLDPLAVVMTPILFKSPPPFHSDLQSTTSSLGLSNFLNCELLRRYVATVTFCYRSNDASTGINVTEIMGESLFTFTLPMQIM